MFFRFGDLLRNREKNSEIFFFGSEIVFFYSDVMFDVLDIEVR